MTCVDSWIDANGNWPLNRASWLGNRPLSGPRGQTVHKRRLGAIPRNRSACPTLELLFARKTKQRTRVETIFGPIQTQLKSFVSISGLRSLKRSAPMTRKLTTTDSAWASIRPCRRSSPIAGTMADTSSIQWITFHSNAIGAMSRKSWRAGLDKLSIVFMASNTTHRSTFKVAMSEVRRVQPRPTARTA